MPEKHIPDGAFSVTHYLPKKKITDNKSSPASANTNISAEKNIYITVKVNKYPQTIQKVVKWENCKCY